MSLLTPAALISEETRAYSWYVPCSLSIEFLTILSVTILNSCCPYWFKVNCKASPISPPVNAAAALRCTARVKADTWPESRLVLSPKKLLNVFVTVVL